MFFLSQVNVLLFDGSDAVQAMKNSLGDVARCLRLLAAAQEVAKLRADPAITI